MADVSWRKNQIKSSLSRRDEVVINRLRIGYIHNVVRSGADQPDRPVILRHFWVEPTTNGNSNETCIFQCQI